MQSPILLQKKRNSAAQAAQKTCCRLRGPATLPKDKHCVYSTARNFVNTQVKHPSNVLQRNGMLHSKSASFRNPVFHRATWSPFLSSNPFSIANSDLEVDEYHLSVDLAFQTTRCCDTTDMAMDIFFPLLAV